MGFTPGLDVWTKQKWLFLCLMCRSRSNAYYCHGRTIQFWFEIHFGLWFISLFILIADIERYRVMTLKLSFIALLCHFEKNRDRNVAGILHSCTCNVLNCKSKVLKIQMKVIPYCKFAYCGMTAQKRKKKKKWRFWISGNILYKLKFNLFLYWWDWMVYCSPHYIFIQLLAQLYIYTNFMFVMKYNLNK